MSKPSQKDISYRYTGLVETLKVPEIDFNPYKPHKIIQFKLNEQDYNFITHFYNGHQHTSLLASFQDIDQTKKFFEIVIKSAVYKTEKEERELTDQEFEEFKNLLILIADRAGFVELDAKELKKSININIADMRNGNNQKFLGTDNQVAESQVQTKINILNNKRGTTQILFSKEGNSVTSKRPAIAKSTPDQTKDATDPNSMTKVVPVSDRMRPNLKKQYIECANAIKEFILDKDIANARVIPVKSQISNVATDNNTIRKYQNAIVSSLTQCTFNKKHTDTNETNTGTGEEYKIEEKIKILQNAVQFILMSSNNSAVHLINNDKKRNEVIEKIKDAIGKLMNPKESDVTIKNLMTIKNTIPDTSYDGSQITSHQRITDFIDRWRENQELSVKEKQELCKEIVSTIGTIVDNYKRKFESNENYKTLDKAKNAIENNLLKDKSEYNAEDDLNHHEIYEQEEEVEEMGLYEQILNNQPLNDKVSNSNSSDDQSSNDVVDVDAVYPDKSEFEQNNPRQKTNGIVLNNAHTVRDLHKGLGELSSKIETLENNQSTQIVGLSSKIEELQTILKNINEKAAETENARIQNNSSAAQGITQEGIDELEKEKEKLQRRNNEKDAVIVNLQSQLEIKDTLFASQKQINQQTLDDFNQQLSYQQQIYDQLAKNSQQILQAANDKLNYLTTQLSAREKEVQDAKVQLAEAEVEKRKSEAEAQLAQYDKQQSDQIAQLERDAARAARDAEIVARDAKRAAEDAKIAAENQAVLDKAIADGLVIAAQAEKDAADRRLIAAQNQKDAAEADKSTVEKALADARAAHNQAVSDKTDAYTRLIAAQADQAIAEAAARAAEGAKRAAEADKNQALQEKAAAEDARNQALQEKNAADALLIAAQAEKDAADRRLIAAQNQKDAAEADKNQALLEKTDANTLLIAAQADKAIAEAVAKAAEADKNQALLDKAAAEDARNKAVLDKADADRLLIAAQYDIVRAEAARDNEIDAKNQAVLERDAAKADKLIAEAAKAKLEKDLSSEKAEKALLAITEANERFAKNAAIAEKKRVEADLQQQLKEEKDAKNALEADKAKLKVTLASEIAARDAVEVEKRRAELAAKMAQAENVKNNSERINRGYKRFQEQENKKYFDEDLLEEKIKKLLKQEDGKKKTVTVFKELPKKSEKDDFIPSLKEAAEVSFVDGKLFKSAKDVIMANRVVRAFKSGLKDSLQTEFDDYISSRQDASQLEIDYYRNHRNKILADRGFKDLSKVSDEKIAEQILKDKVEVIKKNLPIITAKLKQGNPKKVAESLSAAEMTVLLSVGNAKGLDSWRQENPDGRIDKSFLGKLRERSEENEIRSKAIENINKIVEKYGDLFFKSEVKVEKNEVMPTSVAPKLKAVANMIIASSRFKENKVLVLDRPNASEGLIAEKNKAIRTLENFGYKIVPNTSPTLIEKNLENNRRPIGFKKDGTTQLGGKSGGI